MPGFLNSPAAEQDLESILAWTQAHFGEQARLRYEALLAQGSPTWRRIPIEVEVITVQKSQPPLGPTTFGFAATKFPSRTDE